MNPFEIQNYASFIAAILAFQLAPGAGTLFIVNAAARRGVAAGFCAVGGTLLGDFIYMVGALLGLAAVMHAHPDLFRALQWFGAGYLCWVGLRMLWSPLAGGGEAPAGRCGGVFYFRQALLVAFTNPKAALFFFAFFPLFMQPDAPASTLAALVAHVTVISFLYQAALVLTSHAAARRLASLPLIRRVASRLAGLALVAFGIRLAAASRQAG